MHIGSADRHGATTNVRNKSLSCLCDMFFNEGDAVGGCFFKKISNFIVCCGGVAGFVGTKL